MQNTADIPLEATLRADGPTCRSGSRVRRVREARRLDCVRSGFGLKWNAQALVVSHMMTLLRSSPQIMIYQK